MVAHTLRRLGILATIEERVRFARRRFGHYDLIDFTVVVLGYALSGERTLEAFYASLQPFAAPFMALFGRERLPHRSTLSRFLAALTQAAVEAVRTVFLEDLLARPLEQEERTGGLWDRQGHQWGGSTWMAHGKLLANAPCHPPLICHQHSDAWTKSVLQAISGASAGKPCEPGPPCFRPIPTNGSARFLGYREQATVITEGSYDRRCRRSARIYKRKLFPYTTLWCA